MSTVVSEAYEASSHVAVLSTASSMSASWDPTDWAKSAVTTMSSQPRARTTITPRPMSTVSICRDPMSCNHQAQRRIQYACAWDRQQHRMGTDRSAGVVVWLSHYAAHPNPTHTHPAFTRPSSPSPDWRTFPSQHL